MITTAGKMRLVPMRNQPHPREMRQNCVLNIFVLYQLVTRSSLF